MRRILPTIALAFFALAVLAAPAIAASPSQIFRDLDDNGVLDGKYSAADLRAADKVVTAQQREYGGWDDAYDAAMTRATAPKPKPGVKVPDVTPVAPIDSNNNGKFDPNEEAAADKITAAKEVKAIRKANAEADAYKIDDTALAGSDDEGAPKKRVKAEKASSRDDSGDHTVVAIVLIILAALIGVTMWRVIVNRRRNHGDPRAARDEFRPENEGRNDLEHDAGFDQTQTIETTPLEPGLDPNGMGNPNSGISDVGPDDPRA